MFGPAGTLYVYLIYGIHHCANVVTGAEGDGQAVLIRALEPLAGIEKMRAARTAARTDVDLTNGPGKVCEALGIDRSHNGTSLTDGTMCVHLELERTSPITTGMTTRVGISVAQQRPWRWYVQGSDWVSRPKPGVRCGHA